MSASYLVTSTGGSGAGRLGTRCALADLVGDARAGPALGDERSRGGVRRGESRPLTRDDGPLLHEMREQRVKKAARELCILGDGTAIAGSDLDESWLVEQLVPVAREEEPEQAQGDRLGTISVPRAPGEGGDDSRPRQGNNAPVGPLGRPSARSETFARAMMLVL